MIVIAAVVAAVSVAAGYLLVALTAAVLVVLVAPFRELTVTVDQHELRVDFSGPYWRPIRVRRSEILNPSAVDIRPLRHGGWGYRGSLTIFRRLAVILRGGPALRVDIASGGWLFVTVEDPESAVAELQTTA